MVELNTQLGISTCLTTNIATAEVRVRDALKAEGFGILTEIDVKATFKKKLDVDFRPYKILGACNPPLAHRALTTDAQVGLLLPCNVILNQIDEETVQVVAIDPLTMLGSMNTPELEAVAAEAREKLERAIEQLNV